MTNLGVVLVPYAPNFEEIPFSSEFLQKPSRMRVPFPEVKAKKIGSRA
ncbi:MAG: hypothetical protein H9847_00655 [Candidatus Anaerobiospirillum pullicola]|uniref:Uncharacterized protein n=1 Tax=Candidatus Anaerobiospirillum pullicola TaxID=2838451 RepID=A0A948WY61_9GAMM|nr:hypothetical protein [Candidatus Anaerobiospirillum pullicola]